MHPQDKYEVKVKVATRQQTLASDAAMISGLLLLVLVSVVVLIGRSAGGM